MKDEFKKIIYMGLGAMSLTSEKALELKEDLEKRGQELFEKGKVVNEELKHDISEKIKENVTVTITKDFDINDVLERLDEMSEEDKQKLLDKLNNKGNKDGKEESNK